MTYRRVFAAIAAPLLIATSALALPAQGAEPAQPAELSDRCRALVDTFDEASRSVPDSEDLDAAQKLRRMAARDCFDASAPAYMIQSGIEDLQDALRKIGVAATN